MRRFLVGSVVFVSIAVGSSAYAGEMATSNDELLRRLAALENSNANLEKENASLRGQMRRLKNSKQVARTEPPDGLSVSLSGVPSAPRSATAAYASAPMSASPFNWTGFYVGGNAGYGWQQVFLPPSPGQFGPPSPSGGFWGGQVGANYQFASNWVVGVEFNGAVARMENTIVGPDPLVAATLLENTIKVNSLMMLRARIGFAWDRNLVYVTGGPAWINAETITASSNVGAPRIVTDNETERGWTVGGGLERALWSNWTGRIEYQYIHSNPFTVNSESGPAPGVRADLQTVTAGVNYLFH